MKYKKLICMFFVVVLITSANGAIVLAESGKSILKIESSSEPTVGIVEIENKGLPTETSKIIIPDGINLLGIPYLNFKKVSPVEDLDSLGLSDGDKIEFKLSSPSGPLSAVKTLVQGIMSYIRGVGPKVSLDSIKVVREEVEPPEGDDDDDDDGPTEEKKIIEGCVRDSSGSPIEATIEIVPAEMLPYIGYEPLTQKAEKDGSYMVEVIYNEIIMKVTAEGYKSQEKSINFIGGSKHIKRDWSLEKEEEIVNDPIVLDLEILDIEQKTDEEEPQILMTVVLKNEGKSKAEVTSLGKSLEYTITGPEGEVSNYISQSSDQTTVELCSGGVDSTILDIWEESLAPTTYEVTVSYSSDGSVLSDSEEFLVLGDDPNPRLSEEVVNSINDYGLGMQTLIAEDMGYDEISAPFAPFLSMWNDGKMLLGASGDTKIDVLEGMKCKDIGESKILDGLKVLRDECLNKHDENITMELYSNDWINNHPMLQEQFRQEYIDALKDPSGPWNSGIDYVPFNTKEERDAAVDAINDYVKMATHELFDKIVDYDDLSYGPDPCCDQTHFALLNVQYVHAKIPQRRLFGENSIQTMPFYSGPGQTGELKQAEFMTYEGKDQGLYYMDINDENYPDTPNMQILEMRLEDQNYALTFYKPKDGETLSTIIPAITNDNIKAWKSSSSFKNGQDIKIHMAVPKLDIMYDEPLDIIPYLEASGMEGPGNPFIPETADFSGIYKNCGPCGCSDKPGCVSLVNFQCRMKLNETGFEAAAAQDEDEVEAFVTLDEPFFMTFEDVSNHRLVLFTSTVCANGVV